MRQTRWVDTASILGRHPVVHRARIAAREAVVEPWPTWIDPEVVRLFGADGVHALWGHQAQALSHLAAGRHVVVSTGTASGKSLVFMAPALHALLGGRAGAAIDGHRRPTVLYLAPTKALAGDQLRRLPTLPELRAATVDGDNSREQRIWARDHANYVLTNPDVLHHSVLPGHDRWARLLSGLRYVVVDECHHYRGVFGAHVAQILRRLRRVCAHHGADPQFILSSATVAEPGVAARRLTGLEVVAVTDDASPHGPRDIALVEPAERVSASTEASALLTDLVVSGVRTLVFVRSRRGAEAVAAAAQRDLAEIAPELPARVATYRGGYLPEERRELEQRLRSGDLLGLATTNALELGIDVSGLEAIVTTGFPGTRAALWQQFGRAGRDGRASLGVFVARDDPLDSFLVHHPEALLSAPIEATVFDPDNPYVLGPHLAAAAHEVPIRPEELPLFGPRAADGVESLTAAGLLRRRPAGWFWTGRGRPSDLADIRSSGGHPVQIVDGSTGRLIGTVDAGSADAEVHAGAVYVHQGVNHVVEEYDLETGVAVVTAKDTPYTTSALSATTVTVVDQRAQQVWGPATVNLGSVEVAGQVTGYAIRDRESGRIIGEEPLELPVRTLPTTAVWWTLSAEAVEAVLESDRVPGAAHAAEHASIGLLPLLATCDRWDLGGVSTALHPDTGTLTVFVHDGHAGGAGFAERGFDQMETWLRITRQTIAECPCADGCPACVVSPKCGNGNNPLDKAGAVILLDTVLAASPGSPTPDV